MPPGIRLGLTFASKMGWSTSWTQLSMAQPTGKSTPSQVVSTGCAQAVLCSAQRLAAPVSLLPSRFSGKLRHLLPTRRVVPGIPVDLTLSCRGDLAGHVAGPVTAVLVVPCHTISGGPEGRELRRRRRRGRRPRLSPHAVSGWRVHAMSFKTLDP